MTDIAIDEKSAVLVEANGKSKVVGSRRGAYFLHLSSLPQVCKPNSPLTMRDISAYRAPTGAQSDLKSWTGLGGESYSISVENGIVHSTRQGNAVY